MASRRRIAVWGAVAALAVAFVLGELDVRRRALNSDFTVFSLAGAAFFDGRDPYAIANPQGWHYAYPPLFALLVAPLARLSFPDQVAAWFAISSALGLLCAVECRRIVRTIGREEPRAPMPRWIAVAGILTVLFPALDTLQRGQVALALAWPLLLGLRLALEARGWARATLAGAVLALPIAIKLTPVIPIGLLVLAAIRSGYPGGAAPHAGLPEGPAKRPIDDSGEAESATPSAGSSGRRESSAERLGHPWAFGLALGLGVAAGLALFLLVVPAALLGWSRNAAHLETWAGRIQESAQVGVDKNKYTFRNQSFVNAVEMFARWEHPKSPQRWLSPRDPAHRDLRAAPRVPRAMIDAGVPAMELALAALVIAAGWRLARGRDGLEPRGSPLRARARAFAAHGPTPGARGDALGLAAALGLASALSLVVSPISWAHHYVLWLPAALFVPWWLWRGGRRATARCLTVLPPALAVIHYLLIDTGWVERPFGRSLVWTVGLLGVGAAAWCAAAAAAVLATSAHAAEPSPDNFT